MATAVQTALSVQSALSSLGSPPMESDDASKVKGEDTDGLVTGVGSSFLSMFAVVAVVSAGKFDQHCPNELDFATTIF